MKFLAVLLFHNDEDLVEDQIKYWIKNEHDIVIFDHNSSDQTIPLIEKWIKIDRESTTPRIISFQIVPKSVPFVKNGVFEYISKILIRQYSQIYDWISFVESDEFLEGPDRSKSYKQHLESITDPKFTYVKFHNYVFCLTEKDDPAIESPRDRIKYYAYKPCGPKGKVYAWRGANTNIRFYNHNPITGLMYPIPFKTGHYEIRSLKQAREKLADRIKSLRGESSGHRHSYVMAAKPVEALLVPSHKLHFDNGGELIQETNYDWAEQWDAKQCHTITQAKRNQITNQFTRQRK